MWAVSILSSTYALLSTELSDKCTSSILPLTYWSESTEFAAVTLPSRFATNVPTA